MRLRPLNRPLPQLLLFVLLVVGLITILVAGATSSSAFSTFNPGWDGASGVRSAAAETGASVDVLTDTAPYAEADRATVVFILAPVESYSPRDRDELRAFLRRGGTIIVAEDFGDGGNSMLASLGATVRFDGRLVADQRRHGPGIDMPVAPNVTASPYTGGVDALMLNRGTVLTNTTDATILVRTSEFAYLDQDIDGNIDGAPLRQYPVVAAESIGDGTVIAVSDPSVFINSMQRRASNAAFVRGLVGSADRVLLDYSRAGGQPPIQSALLWVRRTPSALAGIGLGCTAVIAYLSRTGLSVFVSRTGPPSTEPRERTRVDEASVLAYLRREHPEWSPERIRRVIPDVMSDGEDSRKDE
jgi:hypothetical protein